MSTERLSIRNFGGLIELDIEVKPITIFTGPQASGKSVTAKLLYFFKSTFHWFYTEVSGGRVIPGLYEDYRQRFSMYFPSSTWPVTGFRLDYSFGTYSLSVSKKDEGPVEVDFSSAVWRFVQESYALYETFTTTENGGRSTDPRAEVKAFEALRKYAAQSLPGLLGNTEFYVPASRSLFTYLSTIQRSTALVDPLLVEFGGMYTHYKSVFQGYRDLKVSDYQKGLVKEVDAILKGKYQSIDGVEVLAHSDGRNIELGNVSSGQQELLPLLVTLVSVAIANRSLGGAVVFVEEPEAHIFPATQKQVVEFMAQITTVEAPNFQLVLTTHSPYVLSTFNMLMEAGILSEQGVDSEQLNQIVPRQKQIKSGTVAAYALKNGTGQSIIDPETGLIDSEHLDAVSNVINEEFSELLDLEP